MKKEQSNPVVQIFSTVLSLSVVLSTVSGPVEAAFASNANLPQFVKELTPPVQLGYVESYYKGSTEKPIILIQDLHANYGVQKKISGILEFLQPRISSESSPMKLGMEGASTKINYDYVRNIKPEVLTKSSERLLKEAELNAAEYFSLRSKQPVDLVGIEDAKDYNLHLRLVRQTAPVRFQQLEKLDVLREVLNDSKKEVSRELKKIWKIEKAYQEGKLDLAGISKALGVSLLPNYGEAEKALYEKKMEAAKGSKNALVSQNVAKAESQLSLLSRLLRYQLTLEEVQYASSQVSDMLFVVSALLPGENVKPWQETIQSTLDYYAIALMRDEPLAKNTLTLAEKANGASVVAIAGGFHAAGMAKIFRTKNISYVVIAPVVASHTEKDESLYVQRVLGYSIVGFGSNEQMVNKVSRALVPPASTEANPAATAANLGDPGATNRDNQLPLKMQKKGFDFPILTRDPKVSTPEEIQLSVLEIMEKGKAWRLNLGDAYYAAKELGIPLLRKWEVTVGGLYSSKPTLVFRNEKGELDFDYNRHGTDALVSEYTSDDKSGRDESEEMDFSVDFSILLEQAFEKLNASNSLQSTNLADLSKTIGKKIHFQRIKGASRLEETHFYLSNDTVYVTLSADMPRELLVPSIMKALINIEQHQFNYAGLSTGNKEEATLPLLIYSLLKDGGLRGFQKALQDLGPTQPLTILIHRIVLDLKAAGINVDSDAVQIDSQTMNIINRLVIAFIRQNPKLFQYKQSGLLRDNQMPFIMEKTTGVMRYVNLVRTAPTRMIVWTREAWTDVSAVARGVATDEQAERVKRNKALVAIAA